MSGAAHAGRARRSGFTLLELAVVVAIVAILAGALLKRVSFYNEQAELAAMQTVLGALRGALHMKAAQLIAKGRTEELTSFVDRNPMDLLAEKPSNYIGEYFSPQSFTITPGNWYFDRQKLLLVYIMKSGGELQTDQPKQLRFKIRVLLAGDAEGPEHAENPAHDTIEGVALSQINE
ncbi:type II secretion system protein [Massilia glaciei]|uniref:Type II secretion system protein n=1 Tax=Massilia glaciei TaxID=1524097 RepID=A0A2U2HJK8_9BURK|nr:type II secretion system protein [Massilia glaciei]PWF47727.1 type II secretion system protein [Massilia glaciei]